MANELDIMDISGVIDFRPVTSKWKILGILAWELDYQIWLTYHEFLHLTFV
jgi:hypothetical protein